MPRVRKELTETHQSIAQQVDAFLKSGKKIQEIAHGVSGQAEDKQSYQSGWVISADTKSGRSNESDG